MLRPPQEPKTGTVSLGGNGQFTRLAALRHLGDKPWSASLTEDLDLAISLLTEGWILETTPLASVDQQAVESLKRLIIQRRRWYQGHMTAGNRLGQVWNAPKLSNGRALEVSAYLSVPWLFDLPWSILWHWTLLGFILRFDSVFAFATDLTSAIIGGLIWYALTFAPAIFTTVIYLRRDRNAGIPTAILMGHAFIVMNYLSFICAWGGALPHRERKNRMGQNHPHRRNHGTRGGSAHAAAAVTTQPSAEEPRTPSQRPSNPEQATAPPGMVGPTRNKSGDSSCEASTLATRNDAT